ncbi:BppU family phage baseplate upper protein [Bacillus wiedmannii]|uniref:BppU family phage baseplate upper protein n=1 Tax=Bacillus wiedmannii TaxID=1890302 RepID=UPI000BFBD225|nr:BppU family phage baseplate upper protein [Bacillus wiedmannii]PGZ95759.1 DUF2479 domain-containing protein [Bacillus wiedmannii]
MRTETIIIDLASPNLLRTIAARENDKNGIKVVVNLKERGKAVDLTGYVVKYEAANSNGYFVRNDAVITNAISGTFEYTFSKESVSTRGVWAGYFALEKDTERYTTPDIKVILGRDVKQGSIEIKDYIAEFDQALEAVKGYRKEIDAANAEITKLKQQIAANNVQVGKITQDNGGSTISVSDTSKNILEEIKARGPGMNTIYCISGAQGQTPNNKSWRGVSFLNSTLFGLVWAKDFSGKFFTNYLDNGNWLGWTEHVNSSEIIPKTGGTFTGLVTLSGGVKLPGDVSWTNLTLVNGATTDAGNTPRYMRQGDVIYIVGAVTNVTDSMTIANLPVGIRPTSNCSFANSYLSTDLKKYAGEINVRTDGRITVDWMWNNVKSVSFCISYHL